MLAGLEAMLHAARKRSMSRDEKEAQRRSFAYGNANIENTRVTREMVDKVADRIART
jgi:hypothetical protein